MKLCPGCGIVKPLDEFNRLTRAPDGRQSQCRACKKRYNDSHRELTRRTTAIYRAANRELLAAKSAKHYAENSERIVEQKTIYTTNRLAIDPFYALKFRLRSRMRAAFHNHGYQKHTKTAELLGCDWTTIMKHIESLFAPGMSWKNIGEWHIDHIIPLAIANNEAELTRLFHYKNLQPLWALENMKKGAKLNW